MALDAARRPRYGGELRIETRASFPEIEEASEQIFGEVFETLVRLDERGDPLPWLAVSWSHDVARKRWVFTPRANVILHNGAVWTPDGGVMLEPDDTPIEIILRDLARPHRAVRVRLPDGTLVGTGPFRLTRLEPGKSIHLTAHDAYWRGRPYLDSIQIALGRALKDQSQDFDVAKTDVAELAVTDIRRLKQRGTKVAMTQPMETLALRFEGERAGAALREAVALAIDRGAIHNVLLQRQGEVSAALLPRWLSGYSFVFSTERNVARAKQLAAGSPALAFAYDPQDAVVRAIAERIAVNASEAGITLRAATTPATDVRLVRLAITSRDPWVALSDLSIQLKRTSLLTPPRGAYETETALLDGFRVIPIVHLPRAWALGARVRDWGRLQDVWLDAERKQ
jgi:ABC-type transport system substrate-binding protein